jgi:2-phospho-L-lactate guanylyltransferase (CobY/MobA/RfbA family)
LIRSSPADNIAEKFLKRLVGRTDVEDAFERLNMLTKEENLMAAARNLEVTHRVMELNHHIVNKVTAVEEAVYDVRDNVEVVQGDVCNIKDGVALTNRGA